MKVHRTTWGWAKLVRIGLGNRTSFFECVVREHEEIVFLVHLRTFVADTIENLHSCRRDLAVVTDNELRKLQGYGEVDIKLDWVTSPVGGDRLSRYEGKHECRQMRYVRGVSVLDGLWISDDTHIARRSSQ